MSGWQTTRSSAPPAAEAPTAPGNACFDQEGAAPPLERGKLAGQVVQVLADVRQVLTGERARADGVGRAGSARQKRRLVGAYLFFKLGAGPDRWRHGAAIARAGYLVVELVELVELVEKNFSNC